VVLHEAGRTAEASDQTDAAWLRARDFGSARRALFAPLRAAVQLSAREQEITALLTDGLSTTRVAAVLGLWDRTVEGHVLRACHRLGVGTRERLLAMARTWLL
jgi:DNA-binding CsgD family transcriptional regulator